MRFRLPYIIFQLLQKNKMPDNQGNKLALVIKAIFYTCACLITCGISSFAQQDKIDSLNKILIESSTTDSIRINTLNQLATLSARFNKQNGYSLYNRSIILARRSKNLYGEIRALVGISNFQREDGNFSAAKESLTQAMQLGDSGAHIDFVTTAMNDFYRDYFVYPSGDYIKELEYALYYLKISEQTFIKPLIADACTQTAIVFAVLGDYFNALKYNKRALEILEKEDQYRLTLIRARALLFCGETYKYMSDYSSAIQQYNLSFQVAKSLNSIVFAVENESNLAGIYRIQKRYEETFAIAFRSLAMYTYLKVDGGISYVSLILARAYADINKPDSALAFGKLTVQYAEKTTDWDLLKSGHQVLSKAYEIKKDFKTAYMHNLMYTKYDDSMFNKSKTHQIAYLQYSNEISLKESKIKLLEKDNAIRAGKNRRQQMTLYGILTVTALVLIVLFILAKSYRSKQRANALLEQQKQEIQSTLTKLRSTQAQLIQTEKMASLGELTAGIAHEIQNPLNFVNNFSEVNGELLKEMKHEMIKGNTNDALVLANDVMANQEKINHHGKRAEAIVKGMLQHSRSSSSVKEATDINGLADEYLRLSYHGLRAKDSSFNATMKTDFDETAGNIHIIPQDIGRVLLNLYNNAFFAVSEKKKQQAENYEPTVSIKTKKLDGKIEVSVKDNGKGIPQKVLDKIFQPFFTTKPTGQGTGLGLSLAYDIVKAHGGEIVVQTDEGQGSQFIIRLPC